MIKVDELKLETYDTEHSSIIEKLGDVDTHNTTVNTTMAKGTWEGKAFSTCSLVLWRLNWYFAKFSEDYMQLNTDVNQMISDVDTFVDRSAAVGKLS